MTDTFDWAGLWDWAFRAYLDRQTDHREARKAAAAYLRTRIEAAFVPVERYNERGEAFFQASKLLIEATARAEAAEAWPTKALDLIERVTLEWNETYRKTGTDYAQGYSDCAGVLLSELEKLT